MATKNRSGDVKLRMFFLTGLLQKAAEENATRARAFVAQRKRSWLPWRRSALRRKEASHGAAALAYAQARALVKKALKGPL